MISRYRAFRSAALMVTAWIAMRGVWLLSLTTATESSLSPLPISKPSVQTAMPGDVHDKVEQRTEDRGNPILSAGDRPRGNPPQAAQKSIAIIELSQPPVGFAASEIQASIDEVETGEGSGPLLLSSRQVRRPGVRMSAWLLVRPSDSMVALADSGELGGSQIGGRTTWGLVERAGLIAGPSLRYSRAFSALSQSELAPGFSLRGHKRGVSGEVIIERRIALGPSGRNAFAGILALGTDGALGKTRVEYSAYLQAGLVGLHARDGFAEGAIRGDYPLAKFGATRLHASLGGWAGIQPGLARVDVGPGIAISAPIAKTTLQIRADWRFRIAGGAIPGSGPALTVATDF